MKVCIAEKPSVAKEIADILGAKQRRDGYYEGNGYQVTWTFGHLCELKEPHEYDSAYKEWNLNMLPILPERFGIKLKKDKGIEKQFAVISGLFEKADEIINCGDAGQEGELIQRWVISHANCKKPVKRLWVSSLTEEALQNGFKSLKDAKDYETLFHAGYSRAVADWLLGMNATRLFTIKFGNRNQLLSIGRVQTPTLAMIVNRQLEIENFKPQTYWELKTSYREVIFSCTEGRFSDKEKAQKALEEIQGEAFEIASVETKKGKEAPPRLFDLTSLQVECNKKFGFSADETLKIVQQLYERKLVTYPRVDTTYLPNDIYPKIPGVLKSLKDYSGLTQPLLAKPIRKSSKVFDDKKVTDHHAIIPTDVPAMGISGNEGLVYSTIAKRFIAAFYPDCEVSNTTVLGKVKKVDFKATGKQILEPGWRVVYNREATTDDEQEETQLLPAFKKGEKGPHAPTLAEKQTQPPKPFTEATLLRAMETAGKQVEDEELRDLMKDNGIGRPSTRAAIIETLFKRNYIRKERKNLIATITGVELIKTISNELLKSAELTGKWEFKLRQIEKGEYEATHFLKEMKQMVSELVVQVKNESTRHISLESNKAEGENLICPKCGKGIMLKGKTAMGCGNYKSGCDFKVPFELMSKKLSETHIAQLIEKKKTNQINGFENGKIGYLKLTSDFNIEFESREKESKGSETPEKKAPRTKREKSSNLICPKCKKGNVLKGNAAYGCNEWKNGCNFRLPFDFMGHAITQKQIESIIKKGETPIIKGLLDGTKKINGKLKLGPEFSIQLEKK